MELKEQRNFKKGKKRDWDLETRPVFESWFQYLFAIWHQTNYLLHKSNISNLQNVNTYISFTGIAEKNEIIYIKSTLQIESTRQTSLTIFERNLSRSFPSFKNKYTEESFVFFHDQ